MKSFNTHEIQQELKTDRAFVAAFATEHFSDCRPLQSDFLFACLDGNPEPFLRQLDEESAEMANLKAS